MNNKKTIQDIQNILETMKWNFKMLDDSRILTGVRCPIPYYFHPLPIEIKVGKYWISIRAYQQQFVSFSQLNAINRFITTLNSQSRGTRFVLVGDSVMILDDISIERFDCKTLLDKLESVLRHSFYAGMEIMVLSRSSSVAELYEKTEKYFLSNLYNQSKNYDELELDFDIMANKLIN